MTDATEGASVRVELAHTHTHAGQACAAGQVLQLDAAAAHWLIAHGVARALAEQPDPAPTPDPKPLLRKEPKQ